MRIELKATRSLGKKVIVAVLGIAAGLGSAVSQANSVNARMELGLSGATINDLGDSFGIDAGYFMTPNLRARLGYSLLSYENKRRVGSINFAETVDQSNLKLTLDWFPWLSDNGLFASVGITKLGDPATLSATADNTLNYPLGGVLYSGAQLGVISGTIETEEILPYVGVGYKYDFGNKNGNGAYLQAEVGAVFGLETQLRLSSDNPNNLGNLNTFLQSYADEQNDKFEDRYVLYRLTLGYRF